MLGCSSGTTENQVVTEEPEAGKTIDLPRFLSPAAIVE